ncbi:MAG TPA: RNA-binding transcriptional accessory protein [Firmicutes bacterium]|nr:RNA-binding transcriptional accessory protein [Bacillota bacterium]
MAVHDLAAEIAKDTGIAPQAVAATIQLLQDGNTVPFIARYRKELTGGLDDLQIHTIADAYGYFTNLAKRKEQILASLAEQEKLTEQLAAQIEAARTQRELEDLYRPFRKQRSTKAEKARKLGFAPLAEQLLTRQDDPNIIAEPFAKRVQCSVEEALEQARYILADEISHDPQFRPRVRQLVFERGVISASSALEDPKEDLVYSTYHDFRQPVRQIPPHRVLALDRGERQGKLTVRIEPPLEAITQYLAGRLIRKGAPASGWLLETIDYSLKNLLLPAVYREIRGMLTEKAEEQAIGVFRQNLEALLMQAPVQGKTVLAIDPGFRTGCKVAVVDPTGMVLATASIYPHPPQAAVEESMEKLLELVKRFTVDVIAIGNGTASRETESFIAQFNRTYGLSLPFTIVSEAGASVYSASEVARQELPGLDVSLRGAVSIGRRLQDPLAELVKIDPKSLGVGMYQHDVNQKKLSEALQRTVESCVNRVGVNLNTASPQLLQYVAGIGPGLAVGIVEYRDQHGPFTFREELLNVPRLGPKTFEQCAGFLRISQGKTLLDNTPVHPESYALARKILSLAGSSEEELADPKTRPQVVERLTRLNPTQVSIETNAGEPTVEDIIAALCAPGRDPRSDIPGPVFRQDILTLADLQPGLRLGGTVTNVVDFGAFVDIGVETDGLIHISNMSDRFVRDPAEVVTVGQRVEVEVLEVQPERKRIGLRLVGK